MAPFSPTSPVDWSIAAKYFARLKLLSSALSHKRPTGGKELDAALEYLQWAKAYDGQAPTEVRMGGGPELPQSILGGLTEPWKDQLESDDAVELTARFGHVLWPLRPTGPSTIDLGPQLKGVWALARFAEWTEETRRLRVFVPSCGYFLLPGCWRSCAETTDVPTGFQRTSSPRQESPPPSPNRHSGRPRPSLLIPRRRTSTSSRR